VIAMNAIDCCDCHPERSRPDADGLCFSCGGQIPALTPPDTRADLAWERLATCGEQQDDVKSDPMVFGFCDWSDLAVYTNRWWG
jgi:hypothetical protein